jgi:glucose-1-phosphate cytidylyltransferase
VKTKTRSNDEKAFCFTCGDVVSDINIAAEIAFHQAYGRLATVTDVQPPGRSGALQITGHEVKGFTERTRGDGGLINCSFFVLSPRCIDRIADDQSSLEGEPLVGLAADGELMAFEHDGFAVPMDASREKNLLEELWQSRKAPWMVRT